jgi:hypothetical protein
MMKPWFARKAAFFERPANRLKQSSRLMAAMGSSSQSAKLLSP